MPKRKEPPTPEWLRRTLAGLPELLVAAEACQVLRVSRTQLKRLIVSGRLHALEKEEDAGSSRLKVPLASVEKYLRSLDRSI